MNPLLGVFYHWLGGLASGSFYVPFRGVKRWSWETSWLVAGVFSWIIAPWFFSTMNTSDVITVLKETPKDVFFYSYLFGACWGLGGLTFGLAMRYLGMSLGMAVALGYCTVFGTLIPPIFKGEFKAKLITDPSGPWILAGLVVCVLGIVATALAGRSKEGEMSEEQKRETVKEFDFKKGILVATFSGIMSAFFAFGLSAGDKIREVTYKVDLVNDAAAQGKKVARVDEPSSVEVDAFLQVPGIAAIFEADEKQSLGTVIGHMEKPATLQRKIEALKAKSVRTEAEVKQLAALVGKVAKASEKAAATMAVVSSLDSSLAKKLASYDSSIQGLPSGDGIFEIVDELSTLSEKETALNIFAAGLDLKAIHGRHSLWTGLPVLIVVLFGGFTTNFIWCFILNLKNGTGYQYFSSKPGKNSPHANEVASGGEGAPANTGTALDGRDDPTPVPLIRNYIFAAIAGVTWYFQFFFYSMGETQMGEYKFSSWTLHMASIIIFSSIWGLALREWKGSSAKAKGLLFLGLAILVLSTVIIGYGNSIGGAAAGH